MSAPVVEVLAIVGCPHAEPALELVERVVADVGVAATVRRVDVRDPEAAAAHRFLGSPSIRVNGRDIEPGAHARAEYAVSCRLYSTEAGPATQPDERWLRDALRAAT